MVSPFVHGGQRQRAGCGHARGGQPEAVPQGDGSLHTRIQPGAEQPDTAAHHRPLAGGMDGDGGDGEEVRGSNVALPLHLQMILHRIPHTIRWSVGGYCTECIKSRILFSKITCPPKDGCRK